MRYRYHAIDAQGQATHGECNVASRAELEQELSGRALTLLRARPVAGVWRLVQRKTASWRDLADFCFHLSQMLHAGIPLLDSLAQLRDALTPGMLADAVPKVLQHIRDGATFSQALTTQSASFGSLLLNGVRAGEVSGHLAEVLQDLHEYYLWRDEMAAQTSRALYYPVFAATVMLVATLFLLTSVMPQVRDFVTETGGKLPLSTRVLLFIANGVARYGVILLPGALGLLAIFATVIKRNTSAALYWDRLLLGLPLVGVLRLKAALGQYAQSLALLYDAGIPLLDALSIAQAAVSSPTLRAVLQQARQRIVEGATLGQAFAGTALIPDLLLAMLRTGEQTGNVGTALRQVASYYQRDVKMITQRIHSLIEPCLTLVVGVVLGWIMLAIIGPIFDNLGRLQ